MPFLSQRLLLPPSFFWRVHDVATSRRISGAWAKAITSAHTSNTPHKPIYANSLTTDRDDTGTSSQFHNSSAEVPVAQGASHILVGSVRLGILQETVKTVKEWRKSLTSFRQFDYESDLDGPPLKGPRLVDIYRYQQDPDVWTELLRFRRRNYGIESIIPLWNGLKSRKGPLSQQVLDSGLLELGYLRHDILDEVCDYASRLHHVTGQRLSRLYRSIIGHFLRTDTSQVYRWHIRLVGDFAPSEHQFEELFRYARTTEQNLGILQKLYQDLPFRQLYKVIIPTLCQDRLYSMALKWHNLLIQNGDVPPNSSYAAPLLHHYALRGHERRVLKMTKELVDAGVSFASSTDCSLRDNTFISRELMDRIHGRFYGIAPKTLSDEFCARLFATSLFSVDTVIKGLQMLGMNTIGPLALREIASRSCSAAMCNTETVAKNISTLKQAGISTGTSLLSRLIQKLATEHRVYGLYDVVNCDLHPEAFEDWKLQESLLASYRKAGDQRQIDRTLTVLLLDTSAKHYTAAYWNILLRACLTERDQKEISRILETMQEQNVLISSRSCSFARTRLLSSRQVGRGPSDTDNIPLVINIWKASLSGGGSIPAKTWIEILRRLGMRGELAEVEKLALWLARWYSDTAFKASQVRCSFGTEQPKKGGMGVSFEELETHDSLHPLRVIFIHTFTRAVIAWGFQHSPSSGEYLHMAPRRWDQSIKPYDAKWMWGLRLLLKLRRYGVMVSRVNVAKACMNQLITVFGSGLSKRLINRRYQRHKAGSIEEYVAGMERLWGKRLFMSQVRGLSGLSQTLRIKAIKREVSRKAHRTASSIEILLPKRSRPKQGS
ncbi:MAG: hypothetical protein Q9187_004676 [Circinaria calcarea]